jgi:hypothetical protein
METDMQNLLVKLERKYGRYAIRNLIDYFLIGYIVMTLLSLVNIRFYYDYLALDFKAIAAGQIWRIFTFVLAPETFDSPWSLLFFIFAVNLYHIYGRSLENAWGAFRFNLYFLGGILLTILSELILYLASGGLVYAYYGGLNYVYQAMFFAFATIFPNFQLLIWFVIPIKVKYLAVLSAIIMALNMLTYLRMGGSVSPLYYAYCLAIFVALANFFLFFWMYKGLDRYMPSQVRRRRNFQKQTRVRGRYDGGVTIHKCAVCGRTEQTNPELSFRFCSKCNGNYEYCEEHLFTHQHVQ